MSVPLLEPPETRWCCPNCDLQDVTRVAGPHSRMHACRGLKGLTAPMVEAGVKAKVVAVQREDYVGRELVTVDPENGRPVMNVTTVRDDGQDVTVFAPCATALSD